LRDLKKVQKSRDVGQLTEKNLRRKESKKGDQKRLRKKKNAGENN